MKIHKVLISLIIMQTIPYVGMAQVLKTNVFLRNPQIVNYNFNQENLSYNPIMSIGAGFSYKSKFVELATFINEDDLYGFYTFFGTTIKTKSLDDNLNLHTNWFGEVTFVSGKSLKSNSFIYTTGICFFLNYSFEWGSIGIPLCVGIGYNQKMFSLNTRTIFNLSLNLD